MNSFITYIDLLCNVNNLAKQEHLKGFQFIMVVLYDGLVHSSAPYRGTGKMRALARRSLVVDELSLLVHMF